MSVCLSAAVRPLYCMDPDVTWGRGRGCPLVVHYWADLQSGHGLHCYGNITRTLVTSLRPSRDMTTWCERTAGRGLRAPPAGNRRATQVPPKLRAAYGKRVRLTGRQGGRSQHYCGSLYSGLPLVVFWQQKANAKCYAWLPSARARGSRILPVQNTPLLNWGCRLTEVDLSNSCIVEQLCVCVLYIDLYSASNSRTFAFSALTLLVGCSEEHLACFLYCHTTCMEQAADRPEAAVVDRVISQKN